MRHCRAHVQTFYRRNCIGKACLRDRSEPSATAAPAAIAVQLAPLPVGSRHHGHLPQELRRTRFVGKPSNVRVGSIASILARPRHVRLAGDSGISLSGGAYPMHAWRRPTSTAGAGVAGLANEGHAFHGVAAPKRHGEEEPQRRHPAFWLESRCCWRLDA